MKDLRPGLNPQRLVRLMQEAVERCKLDLSGKVILTEAATGAYVVTPVLAAMAGAQKVFAITKDTHYGTVQQVRAQTDDLAHMAGVDGRIEIITQKTQNIVAQADIITNCGHVRPIDAETVSWLKSTTVVSLMYEAWEFRQGDVDLDACQRAGIRVVGTNERHPAVEVFSYLGIMAGKLLLDAGVAIYRSRILILCDNPFAPFLTDGLRNLGAVVECFKSLSSVNGGVYDAILVAATPRDIPVVGTADALRIADRWPAAVIAQFWGDLYRNSLSVCNISVWPPNAPPRGHMGILPSDIGPDPIVRLQTGGLKAAEVLLKNPSVDSDLTNVAQLADLRGQGGSRIANQQHFFNRDSPGHKISFVVFDELFRDLSWEWLKDAEILHLTQTSPFTREQQLAWFADLGNRLDYLIWGVRVDGVPVGAFGIKGTGERREYWGYIGEKSYWNKGIGTAMINGAISLAQSLKLKIMRLKVLTENRPAIRVYEKAGFVLCQVTDNLAWMERRV